MNIKHIKAEFPIFKEKMNGKEIVYLDSGASSLKPKVVIDAISNYYEKMGVNVHRGVYKISHDATDAYEGARQRIADFINCKFEEVVFTRGTSASLNLVAMSYGIDNINEGDEIIVSELEHHSSLLPWMHVAKKRNAKLVYIPLTKEGRITVDNFKKVLTDKTKVVAINYVSNVMGYIAPIKEIIKLAHEKGAIVSVDAAQAVPHMKVDVQDLGCDFLSFSGHKMCGPTGIGVLYGKYDLLQSMDPIEFGGDMNDYVGLQEATYKDSPYKFESGTPIIASAIGLGKAIDFLEEIGFKKIEEHEKELQEYAVKKLQEIDGIKVHNPDGDTGIITFNVEGVHPHDAATVYDQEGICLRAGHHCAQPLMGWLCEPATLRATFYIYNDKQDVDKFIEATKKAKEFFNYVLW